MGFYAYVRSRPNSMLDPLGAQGWEEGVVVIGGVTISVEALAAAAAIFGISVWACMVSSACLGKAIELMERDVARAIEDACKEKAKKCKPCVPPAGTKMQRVDVVPPSKKHYPWEGTHTHIYVVNQAPYPNCGCFINPDPLQPDMNGIGPFPPLVPVTGGGPES
jgi:type VI secretion system secreted protein VgrG